MRIQSNLKSMNKLLTNYNKEYELAIESLQKCYLNDLVKYQEDEIRRSYCIGTGREGEGSKLWRQG